MAFTCSICLLPRTDTERAKTSGPPKCKPCRNGTARERYARTHPPVVLQTNLATVSREDLAWLGGLVEGEGCFFSTHGAYMGLKVEMADEDVVRRCFDITRIGAFRVEKLASERRLATYTWRVTDSASAYAMFVMLWPWLGRRRRARGAELARAWLARPRSMPAHIRRTGRPLTK